MKKYKMKINGTDYEVDIKSLQDDSAVVICNGQEYNVEFEKEKTVKKAQKIERKPSVPRPSGGYTSKPSTPVGTGSIQSPIPGLVTALLVKSGDSVESGQIVAKMEAMKMENNILAPSDGIIADVNVKVGDSILEGDVIMTLEEK